MHEYKLIPKLGSSFNNHIQTSVKANLSEKLKSYVNCIISPPHGEMLSTNSIITFRVRSEQYNVTCTRSLLRIKSKNHVHRIKKSTSGYKMERGERLKVQEGSQNRRSHPNNVYKTYVAPYSTQQQLLLLLQCVHEIQQASSTKLFLKSKTKNKKNKTTTNKTTKTNRVCAINMFVELLFLLLLLEEITHIVTIRNCQVETKFLF